MAGKGGKPDWLDDDDLDPIGDDDVLDGDDHLDGDDLLEDNAPVLKRGGGGRRDEPESRKGADREKEKDRGADRHDEKDSAKDRKKERSERDLRRERAVRPGEQDITKSPLILGLSVTIVVLALLSGIYFFMIKRETTNAQLKAIDEQISGGQYATAMISLEQMIVDHPKDEIGDQARIRLGKVRVDKSIKTAAPEWNAGLDALNKMIADCREVKSFAEENAALAEYAKTIAIGALDTAEKNRSPELIKVSDEAVILLERYSDADKPPTAAKAKIKVAKEAAEAAILKATTTQATYAEIDRLNKGGKPIEALASRRRLLDRYPDLEKDRKLSQLLEQTLVSEQKAVKVDDSNRAAVREDRPLLKKPLALTLHTRVLSDESSEGRTVWAVSGGCLYGIDTITGDPVWRRGIGTDSPFFPISIDAAVPALLMFDTRFEELIFVNRQTGELIWRQPLGERASGAPLIHNNQIYQGTIGNSLFRIDVQTGEITSKLIFSQPVVSPPALTRDGQHLVIPGNEAISYTLGVQPLECVRVLFSGQRPGAVQVPLMPMGATLLMIENDQINGANLRVFDAGKTEKIMPEVGTARVAAQVKDRVVLRGNQLFIAGERELLSVYTVSDDPEQPKLLPIAKPPTQIEYTGPIFMHAGAGGRLWVASDNLKQFELKNDTLGEATTKRLYLGATGQPIQSIGKNLFIGRQLLESGALSLLQVDGEEMVAAWKTVVGCSLLTAQVAGENLVCVNASGDVFQVPLTEVEAGGFRFKVETSVKIAEGTTDPVFAGRLAGGKLAIACGGKEPRLWTINTIGKIEQEYVLDGPPVGPPVPLSGGVTVPLANKLRTFGVTGGARVDDYLSVIGQQAAARNAWSHVLPLDATHLVVIDAEGKLSRLEYRTTPTAHLQQLDQVALGNPVDVSPVLDKGKLYVTDASGRLQILNVNGFDRIAEAKLANPAVGKLALAGNRLLAVTSTGALECYDTDQNLKQLWSVPLASDLLADSAMLEQGKLLIATQAGHVKALNPDTGAELQSIILDNSIEYGPVKAGKFILVATVDGALHRVESVLGGE